MSIVYQAIDSVEEFLEKLPSFDADIEARRKEADAAGEVRAVLSLQYLISILRIYHSIFTWCID